MRAILNRAPPRCSLKAAAALLGAGLAGAVAAEACCCPAARSLLPFATKHGVALTEFEPDILSLEMSGPISLVLASRRWL